MTYPVDAMLDQSLALIVDLKLVSIPCDQTVKPCLAHLWDQIQIQDAFAKYIA